VSKRLTLTYDLLILNSSCV